MFGRRSVVPGLQLRVRPEHLQAEVDKQSSVFKGFERIKNITLVGEDFTTENGLLTPSLKLKRRVAMQRFGSQIEALYTDGAKGTSASASAAAE